MNRINRSNLFCKQVWLFGMYEESISLDVCAPRAQSCQFEMNTCDNEIITTQIKIFLKLMLIPFVSAMPAKPSYIVLSVIL